MLILGITPMVLIVGMSIVQTENTFEITETSLYEEAEAKLTLLGIEKAETINDWLVHRGRDVNYFAQQEDFCEGLAILAGQEAGSQNIVRLDLNSFITEALDSFTDFESVFVVANNGTVVIYVDASGSTTLPQESYSTKSYVSGALELGTDTESVYLEEPYYSVTTDDYRLILSKPVKNPSNNQVIGVLCFGVTLDTLWEKLTYKKGHAIDNDLYIEFGLGETGEQYIVSSKTKLAISPSRFLNDEAFILEETINTEATNKAIELGKYFGRHEDYRGNDVIGFAFYMGLTTTGKDQRQDSSIDVRASFDSGWIFVAEMDVDEILASTNEIKDINTTSTVSSLVVFVITTGGILVISFVISKDIIGPLRSLNANTKTIAEGDLTIDLEKSSREDEVGDLAESFNKMVLNLRKTIKRIAKVTETLSASSQELASSSEEVNASSEEISSITQQMSKGAQDQTVKISQTENLSEELRTEFNHKLKTMRATSILIDDITAQVNMLALNASIEAARAGEYGRGFSVVAASIRQLAEETKTSLVSINKSIDEIESSLTNSVNEIIISVSTIASVAEETASGAEEASAATEEQAATMEEMSASAQELSDIAKDLEELVQEFQVRK